MTTLAILLSLATLLNNATPLLAATTSQHLLSQNTQEEAPPLKKTPDDEDSLANQEVLDASNFNKFKKISTTRHARHYILGPNDTVSITFFGAPELSIQSLRIPPDGQFTLPGTDFIMAAGLTLPQLRTKVQEAMGIYLKNDKVSVNLIEAKPFAVQITGAVLNPGTYEININPTGSSPLVVAAGTKPDRATPLLSSLLLTAGGVKYDADIEHVKVLNDYTGESFDINLMELLLESNGGDLYLSYGDRIHVESLPVGMNVNPERFKIYDSATFSPETFPVRVYGYVRTPGVVAVQPQQSNNLNSVIMQAGGYSADYAYSPKHIVLMRPNRDGTMTTTKLDPKVDDIALMPNDMIYVPERALGKLDRFAGIVGRLLTPAAILNLYD